MRLQVKTLFHESETRYRLKLCGGQSGMNNSASWVYLAEDIQNLSFLKGGELIITTGLFTQTGAALYDFICTLVICNCSGLIINVGKYIKEDDITPEIIAFCNDNRFPVFIMPWEIHLVDIMQDYCEQFLRVNHREDALSAAFQNAIYQTPVPEGILRTINESGFITLADYRIILVRHLENASRITSPLNSYGLKYHLFQHDNLQVLIYNAEQKVLSLEEIIRLLCYYDSITLGVGDVVHSLTEIGVCYRHARFSLAAAEFWKRPYVQFDELGIFQLLFCTSEPFLLESIYKKYLGKLEQYDLEHDTEYMETLRTFMLADCNLLDTAAYMHAHRNTIVYRIKKVKEILDSDLDNSAIKFQIMMSFYIKEYLSM